MGGRAAARSNERNELNDPIADTDARDVANHPDFEAGADIARHAGGRSNLDRSVLGSRRAGVHEQRAAIERDRASGRAGGKPDGAVRVEPELGAVAEPQRRSPARFGADGRVCANGVAAAQRAVVHEHGACLEPCRDRVGDGCDIRRAANENSDDEGRSRRKADHREAHDPAPLREPRDLQLLLPGLARGRPRLLDPFRRRRPPRPGQLQQVGESIRRPIVVVAHGSTPESAANPSRKASRARVSSDSIALTLRPPSRSAISCMVRPWMYFHSSTSP